MSEEDKQAKIQRIYRAIMMIILTAFITFMVTSLYCYSVYSKKTTSMGKSLEVDERFSKIRAIIDKYYLWKDEIDDDTLQDAAIAGYVAGLGDKYTQYVPASKSKEYKQSITGTFNGIGIYMKADKEKGVYIYNLFSESPAQKAGLKEGDIIKEVDGKKFSYENFNEISDNIRGELGTKVKLKILRDGKELDYEITRDVIKSETVTKKMFENKIGYVKISSFETDTSKSFKSAVEELIKQNATSLIIDLRDNGGGIVDEATQIADYFLDKDNLIMTTKDGNGKKEETKSKENKTFDLPVVILADSGTASASEILIGALKDNIKAKLIGTKTYGKGIIQTVVSVPDGGAMAVTSAEYLTPSGTAIHGVGITPDIEVKASTESKNKDAQLDKAIDELKNIK